jgi:hypothetical protein
MPDPRNDGPVPDAGRRDRQEAAGFRCSRLLLGLWLVGVCTNFVKVDGDLVAICGECWDDADGFVCDCCDRLAETTYDHDDYADGCAPVAVWEWGKMSVCFACLWPLVPAEWVTRHGLSADAAEIAAALAGGEWADSIDELADAARLLAGGVPA